jgi:hypothetical protein
MESRIVHNTGIPGKEFAYEYSLPLAGIPPETDPEWAAWLSRLVERDADAVHGDLRKRFHGLSAELRRLGEIVAEYRPFSVIVYGGTPHIWARKSATDVIFLPPESNDAEVAAALKPYQLNSHELLIEFLVRFGGMGHRWLGQGVVFAGSRSRGKTIFEPAVDDFEAGREYLTEEEFAERRRRFAPWLSGVTLLIGDDGYLWHIGPGGTICLHECGERDVYGTFASLSEFLERFVRSAEEIGLFEGVLSGF